MPFAFALSDELRAVLEKAAKKNPELAKSVYKKIEQITQLNDESTIDHFKNLRHDLKDYKRVHVGSFVLMFKIYRERKFILFDRLEHHDDAYKR